MATDMKCGKCKHEWIYKGDSEHYATCPFCKASVKVKGGEEDENQARTP